MDTGNGIVGRKIKNRKTTVNKEVDGKLSGKGRGM